MRQHHTLTTTVVEGRKFTDPMLACAFGQRLANDYKRSIPVYERQPGLPGRVLQRCVPEFVVEGDDGL